MRFSLKTLLVTVLIVALVISLWTVNQRLVISNTELQKHRNELGYLNITDAKKINFISVPQHEKLNWRWRVKLPEDRKYHLCFKTINISDNGYPRPDCTFFLEPEAEFTLSVICHRDLRGEWNIKAMTTIGHSQGLGFLTPNHQSWLEGRSTFSYSLNGKGQTTAIDASDPAELLRLRISEPEDIPTEDGILVWITEVPDVAP